MAKKFSKTVPEKWITYPDDKEIQLLITPFTYTYLKVIPTEENLSPATFLEIFINSVKAWKGINDMDDKPMKCNEAQKRVVAIQDNNLTAWAVNDILEISGFSKIDEKSVKN